MLLSATPLIACYHINFIAAWCVRELADCFSLLASQQEALPVTPKRTRWTKPRPRAYKNRVKSAMEPTTDIRRGRQAKAHRYPRTIRYGYLEQLDWTQDPRSAGVIDV
jgi:hypothetical protein